MDKQLLVNDFIKQAVFEGASNAPHTYMHELEQSLRQDVLIEKAGSTEEYLQNLINETVEDIKNGEPVNEAEMEDEQGQGYGYHVVMNQAEYEEWMNHKEMQDKNVHAKNTLRS